MGARPLLVPQQQEASQGQRHTYSEQSNNNMTSTLKVKNIII